MQNVPVFIVYACCLSERMSLQGVMYIDTTTPHTAPLFQEQNRFQNRMVSPPGSLPGPPRPPFPSPPSPSLVSYPATEQPGPGKEGPCLQAGWEAEGRICRERGRVEVEGRQRGCQWLLPQRPSRVTDRTNDTSSFSEVIEVLSG